MREITGSMQGVHGNHIFGGGLRTGVGMWDSRGENLSRRSLRIYVGKGEKETVK